MPSQMVPSCIALKHAFHQNTIASLPSNRSSIDETHKESLDSPCSAPSISAQTHLNALIRIYESASPLSQISGVEPAILYKHQRVFPAGVALSPAKSWLPQTPVNRRPSSQRMSIIYSPNASQKPCHRAQELLLVSNVGAYAYFSAGARVPVLLYRCYQRVY